MSAYRRMELVAAERKERLGDALRRQLDEFGKPPGADVSSTLAEIFEAAQRSADEGKEKLTHLVDNHTREERRQIVAACRAEGLRASLWEERTRAAIFVEWGRPWWARAWRWLRGAT